MSVQILHSGGNHWITISTVGQSTVAQSTVVQSTMAHSTVAQSTMDQCTVDQSTKQLIIKIYDGLDNELSQETKQQVAALLNTKESDITFKNRPVQVNLL